MPSLASCCTRNGAGDASTPYRRLHRSRSASWARNSGDAPANRAVDAASSSSSSRRVSVGPAIRKGDFQLRRRSDGAAAGCVAPSGNTEPATCCTDDCTFMRISSPSEMDVDRVIAGLSDDANTVLIKIGIVGDEETGKTSFMAKYGGMELKKEEKERKGVGLLQKLCKLPHANLAVHLWDLGASQWPCSNTLIKVCQDAAAIFIMFDLTRRSTLHSVKRWFLRVQECNKVAMFVLIGTKYDGFVQMPNDMQLAIIQEVLSRQGFTHKVWEQLSSSQA